MAVAFTRISYWLWGGTDHEAQNNSSLSPPDFPSGFREPDSLKFPSVNGSKMRSSSRRIKRKWHSREERRIDREYDIVLVPSDGGCMSGSESDDSDWSIGWLEPHAPDFQSESETENSFAVLVPCYGRGRCEQPERLKTHVLGAGDLMDGKEWCFHSVACNVYLEQLSRSVVNGVTPQLKLLFPLVINLNTKGQKEEVTFFIYIQCLQFFLAKVFICLLNWSFLTLQGLQLLMICFVPSAKEKSSSA